MSCLIESLAQRAENDTKVRATLRRSLAFEPGEFPQAYRYVEPFLTADSTHWRREVYYLIAGLWATHGNEELPSGTISFAKACADYMKKSQSASVEGRFISIISADREQLKYRLRQMIMLLKGFPVDFKSLQHDLCYWNGDGKSIQSSWAREFYNNLETSKES
jgi:CRISPR system Cascade subunit CasB